MKLRLTQAIINEWQVRCIGDVIPALASWAGEIAINCDDSTVREIAADCLFYMDPKAIDATAAERAAYRGLFGQIQKNVRVPSHWKTAQTA